MKITKTKTLLLVAMLATSVFLGPIALYSQAQKPSVSEQDDEYNSIYKLMLVINMIRKNYVDADKVTYKNILRGALKGIMAELDPFCSYMEPDVFKQMADETEEKDFGGVGMMLSYKDGVLIVIAPMEDAPAFKAGVKAGDVILEIDGNATSQMNFVECVNKLKGEPKTTVKIKVLRQGKEEPFNITITRENIDVSAVKGAKIIDNSGIAYIRIIQFNIPTAANLDEALAELKKNGMKSLILDLRGNPGGLLGSAVDISSRFIETGKLVISTEGRDPSLKNEFKALHCRKYLDSEDDPLPMVILIDNYSASAAEIVSGCLKDYKRAILVGTRTFGKGSVQTISPLPEKNEGAIRLTTAKYYTPNRLQIHEHGIEPDINVPMPNPVYQNKIYTQRLTYPGVVKPEGNGVVVDIQLERAIEILKGINVYKTAHDTD
jgi:carboxyl-terminal processing protease